MEEVEKRKNRETRGLNQDLLELVPRSNMHESYKIVFTDYNFNSNNAHTSDRGWDIFFYFYGKKDKVIPVSNPWNLNLGRLVVSNVFLEPILIKEIEKHYHPLSMIVRMVNGYCLLDVTKELIIECF